MVFKCWFAKPARYRSRLVLAPFASPPSPLREPSPPNRRHRFLYREPKLPVALGLPPIFSAIAQGIQESRLKLLVGCASPHDIADIEDAIVVEAGFEHALRRQAYTVTGAAKGPAVGSNYAYRAPVTGNLVVVGSRVGRVRDFLHIRKMCLQVC